MSVEAFAVINSENNVVNTVLWDKDAQPEWFPGDGFEAIFCGNQLCQIGDTFNEGVFSPPPVVETLMKK
ncbi:hypothetical protein J2125_000907 [Erwinia toletana]|uniref:Uncharacterized protein n=1 Tax=Winslowiella toletana TaxID=92490 RepID=A0ABS4P522_9GAMM|nr:hypothetical protein [Winslowiella toletana]MBP2167715.1 hypothetical protein [Winslowiella toletana]